MDNFANTHSSAPSHKRPKMSLFDTPHSRNGGNSSSFVNTSNTGIMDTTFGSITDEEDDDETEQHYLNKMTDDTDRRVETVFGKGIEVWKSFSGTVYADVNDKIKKQRRDEEVWGKKKEKRKRAAGEKSGTSLQQRFDSLRNSKEVSAPGRGSTSPSTPGLTPSTHTDSTVSYPSLPSNKGYQVSLPRTPTASEWEIFPVRQSQYEDFSGAPLKYKALDNPGFQQGSTGIPERRDVDRYIGPSPQRAHQVQNVQFTPTLPYTHLAAPKPSSATFPSTRAPREGFSGTIFDGARKIVSGSFGSFDGGQVDRFDERRYRLLPGQMGEGTEKKEQDGDKDRDGKPNKLKGRPWLRRG